MQTRTHSQTLDELFRMAKQLSRKMQYCYIRLVCKNYRYLLFFMIYFCFRLCFHLFLILLCVGFFFIHIYTRFSRICVHSFRYCIELIRFAFCVLFCRSGCIRIHFIYCEAAYSLFVLSTCMQIKHATPSPLIAVFLPLRRCL